MICTRYHTANFQRPDPLHALREEEPCQTAGVAEGKGWWVAGR